MIQPHELFPGAWLLDKDGQPFEVDGFFTKPSISDHIVNGTYRLSECRPIKLTDKIVNQFDVINGVPDCVFFRENDPMEWNVVCIGDWQTELAATHLHQLQAFFNLHYSPITINETDLEMADEGLTAIINIDTSEQYDDGEWKAIEVYQPNTETK